MLKTILAGAVLVDRMDIAEAIDYLRCLGCGGTQLRPETSKEPGQGRIVAISCTACRHRYPVVEGIILTQPMLWGVNSSKADQAVAPTFSSYSNWWQKVNKGIGYQQNTANLFHQHTGLPVESLASKSILDAGCGGGRFLRHVAQAPGSIVVAFDLGHGLLLARERNHGLKNVLYVQGDILHPPFREGTFDLVYSFGVLHHTQDPHQGFLELARLVRFGGLFAIYLYYRPHLTFRDWGRRFAFGQVLHFLYREPVRSLVTRLPHSAILLFSRMIAWRGPLLDHLHARTITRPIATLANVLLPPSVYKPRESRQHNVVRNYDHYSTRYNFSHSPEEIITWYQEAGFNNIIVRSLPVTITGEKCSHPCDPVSVTYYRQSLAAWEELEAEGIAAENASRTPPLGCHPLPSHDT